MTIDRRAGFNDDEIVDFVEYTRSREVEVRFIEFMPFSGNRWDDSKLVAHVDAVRALLARFPAAAPALPRPHDTARVRPRARRCSARPRANSGALCGRRCGRCRATWAAWASSRR